MKKYFLLTVFIFCCSISFAQTDSVKITGQSETEEYNMKAAFIYNFSQYIEWQPTYKDGDFIIGVFGPSPILDPLNEIAKSKTIDGKRIVIVQINKPDEIGFCHILFIPQNNSALLNIILSKVPKGTLTISETAGAAKQGVTINFVIINNKLRFEANLQAISIAGLKASSELLKLAVLVD